MKSEHVKDESNEQMVGKHKGGRPSKKVKRSVIHMLRLTPLEQFAFSGKARKAGISLSEFLRKVARKGKVVSRLTTEEAAALRMLAGMANNLNQLTKLSHQGGLFTLATSASRLLGEVTVLMQNLISDDRQGNDG